MALGPGHASKPTIGILASQHKISSQVYINQIKIVEKRKPTHGAITESCINLTRVVATEGPVCVLKACKVASQLLRVNLVDGIEHGHYKEGVEGSGNVGIMAYIAPKPTSLAVLACYHKFDDFVSPVPVDLLKQRERTHTPIASWELEVLILVETDCFSIFGLVEAMKVLNVQVPHELWNSGWCFACLVHGYLLIINLFSGCLNTNHSFLL